MSAYGLFPPAANLFLMHMYEPSCYHWDGVPELSWWVGRRLQACWLLKEWVPEGGACDSALVGTMSSLNPDFKRASLTPWVNHWCGLKKSERCLLFIWKQWAAKRRNDTGADSPPFTHFIPLFAYYTNIHRGPVRYHLLFYSGDLKSNKVCTHRQ